MASIDSIDSIDSIKSLISTNFTQYFFSLKKNTFKYSKHQKLIYEQVYQTFLISYKLSITFDLIDSIASIDSIKSLILTNFTKYFFFSIKKIF